MGSKKQTSTSTTETKPWAPAIGALENILANAGNLFDAQGGINAEFIEKEIADLSPELQAAIKNFTNTDAFNNLASNIGNLTQQGASGLGQGLGVLGGLTQTGITGEDINKLAEELYNSEMVQSSKESLGKDIGAGLDKEVQKLNQQASNAGNMGSSRAGVAQGVMTSGAQEAYAKGSAAIENSAIQNAIGQAMGTLQGNQSTALGAGQSMGQLGLGSIGQMGQISNIYNQGLQNQLTGAGILQNYQQAILNNKWMNQMGQQQMGWDMLNKYLNIAGSIGGMGGSQTTTGTSSSGKGGLGALGTIGGAVAGGIFGGTGGAQLGANIGSSIFGSDERLKDEIETINPEMEGHNEEGVPLPLPRIVRWVWNDLAKALFEEQGLEKEPQNIGVIAQELEDLGLTDFVSEMETSVPGLDGYVKLVNYPALLAYARIVGAVQDEA